MTAGNVILHIPRGLSRWFEVALGMGPPCSPTGENTTIPQANELSVSGFFFPPLAPNIGRWNIQK